MTIADQLKQIRAAFEAWARGNRGQVAIVEDLGELVERLRATPSAPRAYVVFHQEGKRGEFEESGMVDRTFWVTLTRGKGLALETGASLVTGVAGGKPMYDLLEEARETIRALSFDPETTETSVDYKGARPLELDGQTSTDAMRLEFTLGCQLPAVDLTRNPTEPNEETV